MAARSSARPTKSATLADRTRSGGIAIPPRKGFECNPSSERRENAFVLVCALTTESRVPRRAHSNQARPPADATPRRRSRRRPENGGRMAGPTGHAAGRSAAVRPTPAGPTAARPEGRSTRPDVLALALKNGLTNESRARAADPPGPSDSLARAEGRDPTRLA